MTCCYCGSTGHKTGKFPWAKSLEHIDTLRADHLIAALKELKRRHMAQGRVSHASGVQTAINLLQQTVRATKAREHENYAGIFDHQHAAQATHASDAQS